MFEGSLVPQNLPELLLQRAHLSPTQVALRAWSYGRWKTLTWRDYEAAVMELARGIVDWVGPGERVCVLSENRLEWVLADFAILSLAGVSVPSYPTNTPKDIAYILNHSEARLLFVSNQNQLAKVMPLWEEGKLPYLERIVSFNTLSQCDNEKVFALREVQQRNAELDPSVVTERIAGLKGNSLATLIYTSGTTGEPKGVMLSHQNFLTNLEGLRTFMQNAGVRQGEMMSLLPLSHAFERTIGQFMPVMMGFQVSFVEGGLSQLLENLQRVRPTLLIGVPLVYEEIYSRTIEQTQRSPVHRNLMEWALEVGREQAQYTSTAQTPSFLFQSKYQVADRLLYRPLRERLGGRLQFVISGGAPLAKQVIEFFVGAGLSIIEGYGLTETSPVLTVNPLQKIRIGSVGKPLHNVELAIRPEPGQDRGGEILARGENVMLGYFKNEKATKAVTDDEGWFHTGDIGYFDADGYLYLTDRKKELLKTANGKYVAPQPIEKRLKAYPLIEQAVVAGHGRRYCVALIVPHFEVLAHALSLPPRTSPYQLCQDPKAHLLIQECVDAINHDLASWERVRRFSLLPRAMSQASGELTPTLKVKRRVVDEQYKDLLDQLHVEAVSARVS